MEDGKAPIYVRITITGLGRAEIDSGKYVAPDHWDQKNKKVFAPAEDWNDINDHLKEMKKELAAFFLVLSRKHPKVTPAMLKQEYEGEPVTVERKSEVPVPVPVVEEHTLLEVADLLIKDFEEEVKAENKSSETLKQWKATRKKIIEFGKFRVSKNGEIKAVDLATEENDEDKYPIKLSSIDNNFGKDIYRYLTVKRLDFLKGTIQKRRISNLQELAAKGQIKKIKQLLYLAENKNWLPENPISRYKSSGGDKEVQPLELFEVFKIYNKKIDIERLDRIRDAFIVQCFTGFAFQDIANLAPENIIRVGLNGERWLIKDRGKTEISEQVPILPVVEDIIKKYQNDPFCIANNRLFPIPSNTKYNSYLKELADICGINRVLKTHLGRHTFADIMLNICNVPLEDVSKMLGHKNIRTTMRYCKVRKIRISGNMKIARKTLFSSAGKLKKVA